MKITASQFLKNPTGKGSATVARRDRIILDMRSRFTYLYRHARSMFKLNIYLYQDKYYFNFKIPSEDYYKENLFYNVIIEFSPPNENISKSKDLNKYNIRFISNSPNFMFTYGFVYNESELLIDWLAYKLGPKALNEPPLIRNPQLEFGFEKSVYFALLYLELRPRAMKNPLHLNLSNRQKIKLEFLSSNDKLKEYKEKKKKHDSSYKRKVLSRKTKSQVKFATENAKRKTKPINSTVKPIGKVNTKVKTQKKSKISKVKTRTKSFKVGKNKK